MMVGGRRKPAVVAVIILLATSRTSSATVADELIAQGIKLRRGGRDQEALPLFQRALEQQTTPRAFGQVGTCEQALGLWVAAEKHIQEALHHPQDSWVQTNQAPLRSALVAVQKHLGSVEVWGNPPQARVSIDGEPTTTLPMSQGMRVAVGQRVLTIDAPGFVSESRSIEVLAGEKLREHVSLRATAVPLPTPSPQALASAPPSPGLAAPTSSAETESFHATTAGEPPIYKKWWFWAVVGTVAIAAGTSIYFLSTRNNSCQASMGATCTTF